MALQQVQHHAVAGCELTHQRIRLAGRQLTSLPHAFEATLNRDDISLGIQTAPSCSTGHLQEFTPHQGAMAPLCSLRQRRDHRAAGWHVDPRGQRLRRENHLHQSLLKKLLDQLLPSRQHAGVMRRNPPQ